ncbi:MAG: SGNH/GDSL hydrolase family protein [Muribaculaceae bacterium]|nr:SGNH/GDSL hydrolase family protein [Muribaculaceae bacterium]
MHRRHYIALWMLLCIAFAIFTIAAAVELPEVCGHRFRTADISAITGRESEPVDTADAIEADITVPDTLLADVAQAFPVPCDTTAQTILLIGDSMLEGLGPRLAAYAEHNGHTLYTVMWYSSSSERWGSTGKLRTYIDRLHPTYIVLCLGANELNVTDVVAKRKKYVKKIIEEIDTIPYLWIGPPNWRRDTGINKLIADNTSRGCFFLSDGMHFERSKYGAHPTRGSAAEWLDSVMRWMPANALHPIRMDIPEKSSGRPKRIYVHQPDEK